MYICTQKKMDSIIFCSGNRNAISPISFHSSSGRCCSSKSQALALNPSQFLSSNSVLKLKKQISLPSLQFNKFRNPKTQGLPITFSAQSNFFKVVQTVWKVGKDGIEAGTNLVPDSIPRSIARISVTVVALALALFVVKSFISTAFFVLAMMGLIYFTFIAFNKDEGPKGNGGSDSAEDSLEEARRIMEKYKHDLQSEVVKKKSSQVIFPSVLLAADDPERVLNNENGNS
ncbi:hypothetical protein ACH5RR_010465 [Cinchona calisaya]|uniref:Transmembrane protein n=1 Tax=Cinchona calisaya TaxID=153742 RepID=A0ABD3AJ06_9GENT